jgi:hypothetical protein
MIYYDLDGVIRDLQYIGSFKTWDEPIFGKSFCDYINDNPEVLLNAPETEYFDLILWQAPITILSIQPDNWKARTIRWLEGKHMGFGFTLFFTETSDEKLKWLMKGDYLVEDSPNFSDYSQIILIDRLYNRNVKCDKRVKTPQELAKLLNSLGDLNAKNSHYTT